MKSQNPIINYNSEYPNVSTDINKTRMIIRDEDLSKCSIFKYPYAIVYDVSPILIKKRKKEVSYYSWAWS